MASSSTVIDHLEREHRRGKTGVAYVYCVHNGVAQTASNFLGSLLRQLAMQSAASLKDIKSCYEHHARYGTRPSLKEIVGLLRSQVETFDQLFIIIDALDECPEQDQTRKSFFAQVRALPPKARLMVTSRNVPTIEKMFKHDMCIEIRAQDQDIKRFINSQIEQRDEFADLLEDHEELRFDITATVLEKANGMSVDQSASLIRS